jgi:hypothetical protein
LETDNAGNSSAAKIAIIAITTKSSISVKAMLLLHRERMPRLLEHL